VRLAIEAELAGDVGELTMALDRIRGANTEHQQTPRDLTLSAGARCSRLFEKLPLAPYAKRPSREASGSIAGSAVHTPAAASEGGPGVVDETGASFGSNSVAT
jgi:hypothetical protein